MLLPATAASALVLYLVAASAAPPVQLVRSTSGTRGSVQGTRYVVEDPRNAFVAGSDRQVVVSFEWEATPGRHHCEASWRDPSGKVVLVSPTDYDARAARFGVYWTLTLPDTPVLGLWAVEATVDERPAGTHTFQISGNAADANVTVRRVLAPKDLYAHALAATVAVHAMGPQGERLWTGSGFYVDDQHFITAFQVIEGASSLDAVLPSGRQLDSSDVATANRREDWALLRTASSGAAPLALAPRGSVSVGDRGVFLDVSEDGSRTLQDVSVIGRRDAPGAGARLNLSVGPSQAALGSPLMNDYGEVVGIMGGALLPGSRLYVTGSRAASGVLAQAPMAVPADVLPDLGSLKPDTFKVGDLLARGVVASPITRGHSVLYGVLGRGEVSARAGLSAESEFSRRAGEATVQITWDSTQKQEGEAGFRVFDVDSRMVTGSRPTKIKVRVGDLLVTTWKLPLATLAPGPYRIDLLFGDGPAWRAFFTVTE